MPDTYSVITVKRFPYRDTLEEWSNRYHFEGTMPGNDTEWKAVADAFVGMERTIVTNSVEFIRAYGYQAGIEHSVYQLDYESPPNTVLRGTFVAAAGSRPPGDIAACVRWYTGELNSRGKKVYCWKYFHDVWSAGAESDEILPAQLTALTSFAAEIIDGTIGGLPLRYTGPQGAELSAPKVLPYLTTRTLKRRGKRPLPGSP